MGTPGTSGWSKITQKLSWSGKRSRIQFENYFIWVQITKISLEHQCPHVCGEDYAASICVLMTEVINSLQFIQMHFYCIWGVRATCIPSRLVATWSTSSSCWLPSSPFCWSNQSCVSLPVACHFMSVWPWHFQDRKRTLHFLRSSKHNEMDAGSTWKAINWNLFLKPPGKWCWVYRKSKF